MVFEGERDGRPEIFQVEVASGRVEQLTDSASRKLGPAYSPDGVNIAFMERSFIRWRVSALDTRTGVIRALSEEAWGACRPAFSPDGLLAYVSTAESPKADLWFREMAGPRAKVAPGVFQRVPDAHNYNPAFSPDGRTIAFASTRERGGGEKWDIFLADRNGRNLVQLTEGPGNHRFPDLSKVSKASRASRPPRPSMSEERFQLILVRHGLTDWNVARRLLGRIDIGLNEDGRAQARAAAEALRSFPMRAVFSSPQVRARETAAPIAAAHELEVEIEPGFDEVWIDPAWQGKTVDELRGDAEMESFLVDASRRSARIEPVEEVQSRAVAAVERLRVEHARDTVVVVSHGDPLRTIAAHYVRASVEGIPEARNRQRLGERRSLPFARAAAFDAQLEADPRLEAESQGRGRPEPCHSSKNFSSGKPTTFENEPSMRETRKAPLPWMA